MSSPQIDPALVAAGSRAAEALIAASSPVADAQAMQSASGMPVVSASRHVSPSSRYADVGTAIVLDETGRAVVHLRRRFVPAPEHLATASWEEVRPGDRIDLVAGRAVGDPTLSWQLCDANGAFDAAELEVPGASVRIALPQGFPGASDA